MRTWIAAAVALLTGFAVAAGAPAAPSPTAAVATDPSPAVTGVTRILQVGLSYLGQYRASVVSHAGHTELVVSGWNGSGARIVPIPGACPETELEWAPTWNSLAVLTRCAADVGSATPAHSAIWIVDVNRGGTLRKAADIPGFASDMQWSPGLRRMLFLYAPGTSPVIASKVANVRFIGAISRNGVRYGANAQAVAEVTFATGAFKVLTPPDLYVYAYELSHRGRRIAYTAAPAPGAADGVIARMYVQATATGARPKMTVNPATAKGPLHGVNIGLMRWAAFDNQIFFIAGAMSNLGAIGGDIYSVQTYGDRPVDLMSGGSAVSVWFRFMNPGSLFVSQIDHGKVVLDEYGYGGTYLRQTDGWASVPYMISNGRIPLAVSIAGGHVAYVGGASNHTQTRPAAPVTESAARRDLPRRAPASRVMPASRPGNTAK